MALRAVIFDFDGLMLDTEVPDFVSWCEVYEAHGCALDRDLWVAGIGTRDGFDPYLHLETLTGAPVDREAVRAMRQPRNLSLTAALPLMEGVEARIDEARALGLKLGIASSSDADWVYGNVDRFGITGHFDAIWCRTADLPAKPAPALYLAALSDLGCAPADAIAFEDSPHGIAAAKAAGLCCIAVPNSMTTGLDLSAADRAVASLAEISLAALRDSWPITAGR